MKYQKTKLIVILAACTLLFNVSKICAISALNLESSQWIYFNIPLETFRENFFSEEYSPWNIDTLAEKGTTEVKIIKDTHTENLSVEISSVNGHLIKFSGKVHNYYSKNNSANGVYLDFTDSVFTGNIIPLSFIFCNNSDSANNWLINDSNNQISSQLVLFDEVNDLVTILICYDLYEAIFKDTKILPADISTQYSWSYPLLDSKHLEIKTKEIYYNSIEADTSGQILLENIIKKPQDYEYQENIDTVSPLGLNTFTQRNLRSTMYYASFYASGEKTSCYSLPYIVEKYGNAGITTSIDFRVAEHTQVGSLTYYGNNVFKYRNIVIGLTLPASYIDSTTVQGRVQQWQGFTGIKESGSQIIMGVADKIFSTTTGLSVIPFSTLYNFIKNATTTTKNVTLGNSFSTLYSNTNTVKFVLDGKYQLIKEYNKNGDYLRIQFSTSPGATRIYNARGAINISCDVYNYNSSDYWNRYDQLSLNIPVTYNNIP